MADHPGLELLFRSVELNSIQDAAVCLLHWEFIRNGFKCTTTGDKEIGSELLPDGWNCSQDVYILNYSRKSESGKLEHFLMKAILIENFLSLNLMNLDNETLSSFSIEIEDFVNPDYKFFPNAYKNITEFKTLIDDELLSSTCPDLQKDTNPKATPQNIRSYPDSVHRNKPPSPYSPKGPSQHFPFRNRVDPFSYGARDLDPFAHGSGMSFDPIYNEQHFEQPPRPRFDLIGPPGVLPDSDHLRRPNFKDFI